MSNEPEPIVAHYPCGDCGAFSLEYVQKQDRDHYEEMKELRARKDAEISRLREALERATTLTDAISNGGDDNDPKHSDTYRLNGAMHGASILQNHLRATLNPPTNPTT